MSARYQNLIWALFFVLFQKIEDPAMPMLIGCAWMIGLLLGFAILDELAIWLIKSLKGRYQ